MVHPHSIRDAIGIAITSGLLICSAVAGPPQGNLPSALQVIDVVEFQNGALSIHAQNASLVDVLRLIAKKTGTIIYVPPGTGGERIVEDARPGPVREVLHHLLDGSHFNFTMSYSPGHPETLEQVVLSVEGQTEGDTNRAQDRTQPATPSVLWTPPTNTSVQVLPPQYDETLIAPSKALSPDSLSELMRRKAQEMRERANQKYPPQ